MKINNFFEKHKIELKDKTLVVACSGGPDSIALVDLLKQLQKGQKFNLIVAHFDHQLRADSFKETKLLQQYCQSNDLKFINGIWPKNKQAKTGIEAAARKARYAFLSKIVRENNGDYLLTAHHGDDLLENILLKFIRSGNPQEMNSLQAIGKMHGIILLRPLLTYSKADLLQYDRDHNLTFIHDETNDEDDVLRNRLRHHVVPLLKKENPKMIDNALRYSDEMTTLTSLSNAQLQEIGQPTRFLNFAFRISQKKLASLSAKEQSYFWRNFIWQKWLKRTNDNLANFNLVQYQGFVYLWPNTDFASSALKKIEVGQSFTFRKEAFVLSEKAASNAIGDFWSEDNAFYVGSLSIGSKLLLQNGEHAKAKKMFAEAKIPKELRPLCLTIFDLNKRPIFIEKTYQDQTFLENGKHYYLLPLKKA